MAYAGGERLLKALVIGVVLRGVAPQILQKHNVPDVRDSREELEKSISEIKTRRPVDSE